MIGPALWGLLVNFMLPVLPGRAGALAGWVVIVTLAAGLAWRAPRALRLPPRALAGVAVAALAVFWAALAVRQLLPLPDTIHVALAATIQAGGEPSALPWTPGVSVPYHYGPNLLMGLLAPPFGPDLAFTIEVLGAYVWTALTLIVAMTILRRGSWTSLLVLTPLVLTTGVWTLIGFTVPPADILQLPAPAGVPVAGVRASIGAVYWPEVSLQWPTWYYAPLPNIWKPQFVLGYALAFTALERAAAHGREGWLAATALALLIGFLGLVEETVALTTLGCWGLLAAVRLGQAWKGRAVIRDLIQQSAAGPALAAALLAVGGGALTGVLTGSLVGGLSLGWPDNPVDRRLVGSVQALPGGLVVLGLGPMLVVAAAVLLGWRDRLAVALAMGGGVFLLAALILRYAFAEHDVDRFDGHARNFALLALLVALSDRLSALRPRWRYATAAVLVALVAWPTVAAPVRTLGLALGHGVRLTNVQPAPRDAPEVFQLGRRQALTPFAPQPVVKYVRERTPVRSRILSPYPHHLTAATGRPNASGFVGTPHFFAVTGPEYADAQRYLEPAAMRRLGVGYVHATDAWIATLPARARRWLADPALFERLIRADGDALYRVQPAFRALDPAPVASSFEALRRAVPATATVYLPVAHDPVTRLRLASLLGHARLLGEVDPSPLHLLTEIPSEPLEGRVPDVGVVPRDRLYDVSRHGFTPIWGNEELVAYTTRPVSGSAIELPPGPANFAVQMGEGQVRPDRVAFSATFTDQASEQWTGQDWLVIEVEDTPWTLPTEYEADGRTHVGVVWFAGQIVPGGGTVTHRYEFDARGPWLAVQGGGGVMTEVQSSGKELGPGTYVLAVRLRQAYLEAAVIPVLTVVVAEDGAVMYRAEAGERRAWVGKAEKAAE